MKHSKDLLKKVDIVPVEESELEQLREALAERALEIRLLRKRNTQLEMLVNQAIESLQEILGKIWEMPPA